MVMPSIPSDLFVGRESMMDFISSKVGGEVRSPICISISDSTGDEN